MNKKTIELVRQSGFKVKHLAEVIEVHPNQLSMALRGERSIPVEKEDKLKTYLSAIPQV